MHVCWRKQGTSVTKINYPHSSFAFYAAVYMGETRVWDSGQSQHSREKSTFLTLSPCTWSLVFSAGLGSNPCFVNRLQPAKICEAVKNKNADISTCYFLHISSTGKKHQWALLFCLLVSTLSLCQGSQVTESFGRELWASFATDDWSNCLPALDTEKGA